MTEQEKDFKTVLFEGLGLASMCWSETPKGVFDDALALKTGNEVYDAHLSDRDKFAMAYSEWCISGGWRATYDTLKMFKQSLTKTDKV